MDRDSKILVKALREQIESTKFELASIQGIPELERHGWLLQGRLTGLYIALKIVEAE